MLPLALLNFSLSWVFPSWGQSFYKARMSLMVSKRTAFCLGVMMNHETSSLSPRTTCYESLALMCEVMSKWGTDTKEPFSGAVTGRNHALPRTARVPHLSGVSPKSSCRPSDGESLHAAVCPDTRMAGTCAPDVPWGFTPVNLHLTPLLGLKMEFSLFV